MPMFHNYMCMNLNVKLTVDFEVERKKIMLGLKKNWPEKIFTE